MKNWFSMIKLMKLTSNKKYVGKNAGNQSQVEHFEQLKLWYSKNLTSFDSYYWTTLFLNATTPHIHLRVSQQCTRKCEQCWHKKRARKSFQQRQNHQRAPNEWRKLRKSGCQGGKGKTLSRRICHSLEDDLVRPECSEWRGTIDIGTRAINPQVGIGTVQTHKTHLPEPGSA